MSLNQLVPMIGRSFNQAVRLSVGYWALSLPFCRLGNLWAASRQSRCRGRTILTLCPVCASPQINCASRRRVGLIACIEEGALFRFDLFIHSRIYFAFCLCESPSLGNAADIRRTSFPRRRLKATISFRIRSSSVGFCSGSHKYI